MDMSSLNLESLNPDQGPDFFVLVSEFGALHYFAHSTLSPQPVAVNPQTVKKGVGFKLLKVLNCKRFVNPSP